MCAAAEFNGVTVADHTHLLAVFFAEEGHGAHVAGRGDGHTAVLVERDGAAHVGVGYMLHLTDLLGGELLEVAEVEAQELGRHEGAALLHMCAEHLTQGLVEEVGGGVVA